MMGEGLSGIFLNTASLIVRVAFLPFKRSFPEIQYLEEKDVGRWIQMNECRIQSFFDTLRLSGGLSSSQSGDDLFAFSMEECSPWFFVLYRTMGFKPSRTTWFESSRYVTFCEEHAIRTHDSGGWTFVDSVKPRYFNICNPNPEQVCSRIRQITGSLKYRGDHDLSRKIIPLVNEMLSVVPEIQNTLNRYHIQAGLPSWLGGIDHPDGLLPEFELEPYAKKILSFLAQAPIEVLLEDYVIRSFTDELAQKQEEILTITSSFLTYLPVDSEELLGDDTYVERSSIQVPARELGEKYSHYVSRSNRHIKSKGLVTVKEILGGISASLSIRQAIEDCEYKPPIVSIRKKLRDRRSHLLSIIPDDYEPDYSDCPTPWVVQNIINRKLEQRLVLKENFEDKHALLNYPSFAVKGRPAL
jgi:hypothetical protein